MDMIELKDVGKRESAKKATFTIENKLLDDLKTISKQTKKKMSPIVNDLIKAYVSQQEGLL